jgi:DNA modification methylase
MKKLKDYEYYRTKYGVIYCGDMFKIIPLLRGAGIDLVLTDPPYNVRDIGEHHRKYVNHKVMKPGEYRSFCREWLRAARELTPNVIFTPGNKNIWNYPKTLMTGCWYKPGARSFNTTGGFSEWEPIFYYGRLKRQPTTYRYTPNNFCHPYAQKHPCPKHEGFWVDLMNNNDDKKLILDPMAGSGTTGYQAERTDRRYILIDNQEKYCELMVERIKPLFKQKRFVFVGGGGSVKMLFRKIWNLFKKEVL